ncbi:3-phosphoshikimate 1-carboxyvinyltransferase [Arcanobacterium canis]
MTWCAPRASAIDARVVLPGSKSLTNRYLILAALGQQPAVIHEPLHARDTELMVRALQTLGIHIERSDREWCVTPRPLHSGRIHAGLSGTVMRFIAPVAALASGEVVIDGDLAARTRPMAGLVNALRLAGVDAQGKHLPIYVRGSGSITGGDVDVDASSSSQFVSALLMAGARMEQGLTLRHIGSSLPSLPHIEMTLDCLTRAGVDAHTLEPGVWRVEPGPLHLGHVSVEPDLTNAGAFLAAAMVTGGQITIPWPNHTTQAGDAFGAIFEQMGADVERGDGQLRLRGPYTVRPLHLDAADVGELVPTLSAVALFAAGPSRLWNIGHLRGHETDRLVALEQSLTALGAQVETGDNWLEISPPTSQQPAALKAYGDHRMAMFAAIVGLRVPVILDHPEETAKTLPQFHALWTQMINDSEKK